MSSLARESVATEYTTFVMRNTSKEHVFVSQYNLECRLWSDTRARSTHATTQTLRCHILSDSQLWMSPRNNKQSHQECCKYVARRSLESNHEKPGGRTNSTYSTPYRRRRKSQCTLHISGNDFQHRPGYLAGCSSR